MQYDKTGKGFISPKDFIAVSVSLLSANFEDKLKIVFNIFDCDCDGVLSPAEIWTVMSNVPLQKMVIQARTP